MNKLQLIAFSSFIALSAATGASAAIYDVYAYGNSSSGGTGLATIALTAGEHFSVSVNPNDLWNAGALPRWSNADGLTGNRYATGTDDSGQPVGTLIGINFGLWSEGNLSAPYGTLVGEIGNGDYFVLGANYNGTASSAGTLKLFYWDSNYSDNSGYVSANVSAVPESATWAMMLTGLAALGFAGGRASRKNVAAA